MNNKTEELRKELEEVVFGRLTYENYANLPIIRHDADFKITTILKVCKKAGLQFVNKDTKFGEFTPINPIEVE